MERSPHFAAWRLRDVFLPSTGVNPMADHCLGVGRRKRKSFKNGAAAALR
jgi:hypothetical protein